jgi:hypothetical protein
VFFYLLDGEEKTAHSVAGVSYAAFPEGLLSVKEARPQLS